MKKSTSSANTVSMKHIPQRTCVGCREVKNKRELVRVVRTPEGNIELDVSGKKNGRGAYICPTRDCWEKALSGKHLERTLHSTLSEKNREELKTGGEILFKGEK